MVMEEGGEGGGREGETGRRIENQIHAGELGLRAESCKARHDSPETPVLNNKRQNARAQANVDCKAEGASPGPSHREFQHAGTNEKTNDLRLRAGRCESMPDQLYSPVQPSSRAPAQFTIKSRIQQKLGNTSAPERCRLRAGKGKHRPDLLYSGFVNRASGL